MLVRRAIKEGRLKAYANGKLDPKLVGTAWRKSNALAEPERPKGANKGANKRSQVFAPEDVGQAGDDLSDSSLEQRAEQVLQSGVVAMLPYADALAKKENFLALLRELEYAEKSGQKVDLEVAERVLFEAARAARDAWLNWPARVGPLIAADLGLEADKVTEVLTAHVHKHVEQRGEPDVQFKGE